MRSKTPPNNGGSLAYHLELPNLANVYGRGRANRWDTYSSARWKDNVRPIRDALGKLLRLTGVEFDWKPRYGGAHDIGFVAEEVGQVLPEIVAYEADGENAMGMDYSRMTALLVEAVRELRAEKNADVAALRAEDRAQVQALKVENAELKCRLDRLEAELARLIDSGRKPIGRFPDPHVETEKGSTRP